MTKIENLKKQFYIQNAEIIDTHTNLRRLKRQELKSPLTRLRPSSSWTDNKPVLPQEEI